MTIAEKLQAVAENEQKVFDAGKDAEYNAFWDAYQEYGNRTVYPTAFYHNWWNDTTYNPKYDIVIKSGASSVFQATTFTNTKVKITLETTSTNLFFGNRNLKTIPYLKLTEKATLQKAFYNNTGLENITFDGVIRCDVDLQYSTKLTRASITSLIHHLWESGTNRVQSDDEYFSIWFSTTDIEDGNLYASISPATYHYEGLKVEEAHWQLYNAETNELITDQWSWGSNEITFTGLDANITYRIEASEISGNYYDIDGNTTGYDSTTSKYVAYTQEELLEPVGTIILSLEAVDREFGEDDLGLWTNGSDTMVWWDLCSTAPDWTISLV